MRDTSLQQEHHRKMLSRVVEYPDVSSMPSVVQDQLAKLRRDMFNVVVLYYGGTIGMHQDESGNLVPTDSAEQLLEPLIVKGLNRKVNVVWFRVYPKTIDSTNGRFPHWVTIGNAIRTLYDLADGFVIVGGTDTMAHVAASMNFMFPNIGKPIILTGSQLPMFMLGDDATRNLYFALATACSDISGAHLAFADKLMHGLHVFKVQDRRFEAFGCETRYQIGHFDGEVQLYSSAPRRSAFITQQRLDFHPEFREGIKVVHLSPATPSGCLLYDGRDPMASVLLLITFGAGNVRNEEMYESETTHCQVIATLREEGVPVVLGSPMMDGKVHNSPYATGSEPVSSEVGAIPAGDTTGPTLEVKCMRCLALACSEDGQLDMARFRQLMFQDHVGELGIKMSD